MLHNEMQQQKRCDNVGGAGANSASPFFFFSPFFPDGRGFGSARREQYAAGRGLPTFRGAGGRTSHAVPDENVGSFSPEREFMGAKAPYGNVAQLAEHLTVNQRGAGSSPAVSAI